MSLRNIKIETNPETYGAFNFLTRLPPAGGQSSVDDLLAPCPRPPFGGTVKRETCALVTKMLPVSLRFLSCAAPCNISGVAKMSPHKLPNSARPNRRIELPHNKRIAFHLLLFRPSPRSCTSRLPHPVCISILTLTLPHLPRHCSIV